MKPTRHHYFIFVRPPGSWTWTLHMRQGPAGGSVPWRSGQAWEADKEACMIASGKVYCAVVVPVKLPQEQDTEIYALLADGDTLYKLSDTDLISKRTGKPFDDGIPPHEN